jgi:hypothetical protein
VCLSEELIMMQNKFELSGIDVVLGYLMKQAWEVGQNRSQ